MYNRNSNTINGLYDRCAATSTGSSCGCQDSSLDIAVFEGLSDFLTEFFCSCNWHRVSNRYIYILKKFSYVSPAAAAGLYLGARAGDFQKPGEPREMFKTMIREITALAYAMGCAFDRDFVRENLKIMDTLKPTASTSLQRDIEAGKPSEIDSLVGEVLRLGEEYHVSMPAYRMVAEEIQKRYGVL